MISDMKGQEVVPCGVGGVMRVLILWLHLVLAEIVLLPLYFQVAKSSILLDNVLLNSVCSWFQAGGLLLAFCGSCKSLLWKKYKFFIGII